MGASGGAGRRGIGAPPRGRLPADSASAGHQECAVGVSWTRADRSDQPLPPSSYLKDLKRIGATADEVVRLEAEILANPRVGDVIPGLNGVRKVRFALGGNGKRGGGRAIYALVLEGTTTAMLRAYAKAEQADMTAEEKRGLAALLREATDG